MPKLPSTIITPRLRLRPWRSDDAAALAPILQANHEYLRPWIPARVATPAPVHELAQRLDGFAASFDADHEWRYAIIDPTANRLLGEGSVFARNDSRRVGFDEADRAEIGYWLREDAMGSGLITEACRALIDELRHIGQFTRVEIRCNTLNAPSNAIPRRLGFTVDNDATDATLNVWTLLF